MLDGVDLDVAAGTTYALLGPNGAGKTTIVQILSTLIEADAGTLRVAGHDPARYADAVRAAIGVTGQFAAVDSLLTGRENLIHDVGHRPRAGRRRRDDLPHHAEPGGGRPARRADCVLDQGRLVAEGTAEELKSGIPADDLRRPPSLDDVFLTLTRS